jgi:hypothetical protein
MQGRGSADSDFEQRAREAFDASVDTVDDELRVRLAAARRAAVQAADRPTRRAAWGAWAPAAALATVAIAAVIVWRSEAPAPAVAQSTAVSVDAVELLADTEGLAIVEDDLAFYEWLDTVQSDAGGAG